MIFLFFLAHLSQRLRMAMWSLAIRRQFIIRPHPRLTDEQMENRTPILHHAKKQAQPKNHILKTKDL